MDIAVYLLSRDILSRDIAVYLLSMDITQVNFVLFTKILLGRLCRIFSSAIKQDLLICFITGSSIPFYNGFFSYFT